jgi:hypothetical protein
MDTEGVLEELRRCGLLMLTDPVLPSVASLVAGEPVRGSWWGHPSGQAIFRTSEELADLPGVALVKLVNGKVTYVHRRLWPALYGVATSRADWQTRGLDAASRALWARVEREGELRADELGGRGDLRAIKSRIDELERRLCIGTHQVHTEQGSHARVLESWPSWARRMCWKPRALGVEKACAALERATVEWDVDSTVAWPWSPARTRRTPGRKR